MPLGAGRLLVSFADEVVWGWISALGISAREWSSILRFDPGPATQLALGSVSSELEGFRRTHREAQRTYLVARRGAAPVTRFADVTVETLALADELAAREYVARELGPLASDDERSERLRETVRAYLGSSSNAAATAALLGVNDRTVAYRLRGVEDLLGYPIATRALELQLALRLHATLAQPT